jgi:hypothetical protein
MVGLHALQRIFDPRVSGISRGDAAGSSSHLLKALELTKVGLGAFPREETDQFEDSHASSYRIRVLSPHRKWR